MAKVMVSLPDDLLRAVDAEASRRGKTRSGLLRELAEDTLQRRTAQRAQRMREIRLAQGDRGSHGGGVADLVKTHRPAR
jgi:metal-responsive CopG/Arc/MetJ family transcriptional regulator